MEHLKLLPQMRNSLLFIFGHSYVNEDPIGALAAHCHKSYLELLLLSDQTSHLIINDFFFQVYLGFCKLAI